MPDAVEVEAEGEEEQPEPAETGENDSDEQPDIAADEQADMAGLADLAEQVEEEAGADTDDEADDETDSSDTTTTASAPESETPDWGDLYVGTVTTGLNAVIDQYGHEDADHIDESLARDLHLHEYVDKWMAEQGRAEMDPAKGIVISTVALCVTVLCFQTDLPSKAVNKAKSEK